MTIGRWLAAALGAFALGSAAQAAGPGEEEAGKRGGVLTYTIPADAPPSFDGHREQTFATLHSAAPFYSVLIRINPENPSSTTDFVCDLCTVMPKPTDGGKTFTFKIRDGVKFHDGSPLSAADVAKSWDMIIRPPKGMLSPRESWYEKNILGSGPFKFSEFETGQSISGVRNPDYYRKGLPYLDGFKAIYADKQAVRLDAIRADRAAIEFRGFPPAARDELIKALGDKITVQESDWNCGSLVTPNHKKKPFDDPRVRRALSLAIDRWHGGPALSKIANVRAVGGIVFPASPLAATKEELQQIAGFWPDLEKSRAEAKRLLKEAGAEGLSFELLNRSVDQPYKYVGTWLVDEWSKIGLHVTQRVMPTGPELEALRNGNFEVALIANCRGVPNPLLDVQTYLPNFAGSYGYYDDPDELALYEKMLRETDFDKQRALMRQFEKYVEDDQAHQIWVIWWNRIIPYRSYVKGWKISPSHYLNQDLATVWLDK